MTTTKTKRPRKTARQKKTTASQPGDRPSALEPLREVSIDAISVVDGANPRKTFDTIPLNQLAASIKQDGLLSPLAVRRKEGSEVEAYELIAGERRLRAARKAGLTVVPVIIKTVDDAAAARMRLAENHFRVDLNPIDEAGAYKDLMEAHGFTHRELAEYFSLATGANVSSGTIGNAVRLLNLSDDWQQKLVDREVTATQARYLAKWHDVPLVGELTAEYLREEKERMEDGETLTTSEFEDMVDQAVRDASRPITGEWYDSNNQGHRWVKVLLTKKDRENKELDIRKVPTRFGSGEEERAFNIDLWNQMQQAGEERQSKREAAKLQEPESDGKPAKTKLTPAQQKAKAEEKEQQWLKRLTNWYDCWLQKEVGKALAAIDVHDSTDIYLKVLLYFAVQEHAGRGRWSMLSTVVESMGGKTLTRDGAHEYFSPPDVWGTLSSLKDREQVWPLFQELVRLWAQNDFANYTCDLDTHAIRGMAVDLGVDIKTHWIVTEDFLQLHNKSQLLALAKEWKLTLEPNGEKKEDLIDAVLTAATRGRVKASKDLQQVAK